MRTRGPGCEGDFRRRDRAPHQAVKDLRCEAVMNHRAPLTIYRHAIVLIHLIARQHQDHLQPRKSAHKATVFLTETNHRLSGDEREVHAGRGSATGGGFPAPAQTTTTLASIW